MVQPDDSQSNMLLITYTSSALSPTDKVRFYYALKGRNRDSGITKIYSIIHLAKQVFMVSEEYEDDMRKFFSTWKMPFTIRHIVLKRTEKVRP